MTAPRNPEYRAQTIGMAIVLAYAAWYAFLALGLPLSLVVNGLLDDSFYYLVVARNVAHGLGSSFDGVEPTNGYHPLWLWLLVPIFAVFRGDETPLRAALLVAGALGVGSLLLIRGILARIAGPAAAIAGLLLFAWPRFFGQTVGLLETGLLLFLYLAVVHFTIEADENELRTGETSGQASAVRIGALLGLACLTRLDSVFLVAVYAAYEVVAKRRFSRALIAIVVCLLILAPYLAWNRVTFGHFLPISGAMKSTFPRVVPTLAHFTSFPEFTALLVVGAGFTAAALRPAASSFVRTIGMFGAGAILQILYLVLFVPWGVDRWYFTLLFPVGLLGLPWLVRHALASLLLRPAFALAALFAGLVAAVGVQSWSLGLREGRYLDATREMALWARANLPKRAVVATTDSGVFAYFCERQTVNLDGLINNYRYREELRAGRLEDYLRERGVGYVLDQYNARHPSWLDGSYTSRPLKIWYRPENRIAGTIELFREDEVTRTNLLARMASGQPPEPNALILWRYRAPGAQHPRDSVRPTPP